MENIKITPSPLKGEISIPPSKSLAHRAVICGGLSEGVSNIENIIFSDDIKATIRGMESLDVKVKDNSSREDNSLKRKKLVIEGKSKLKLTKDTIDCIES
ncbi:MAG: 3-phosphoshikimate 1-carboxyvinyltransferase, partial [Clostridium sp.]|nr:3-phosphoshikimate 1-carboxyvinyltransferase [Clostridium sp.]